MRCRCQLQLMYREGGVGLVGRSHAFTECAQARLVDPHLAVEAMRVAESTDGCHAQEHPQCCRDNRHHAATRSCRGGRAFLRMKSAVVVEAVLVSASHPSRSVRLPGQLGNMIASHWCMLCSCKSGLSSPSFEPIVVAG